MLGLGVLCMVLACYLQDCCVKLGLSFQCFVSVLCFVLLGNVRVGMLGIASLCLALMCYALCWCAMLGVDVRWMALVIYIFVLLHYFE